MYMLVHFVFSTGFWDSGNFSSIFFCSSYWIISIDVSSGVEIFVPLSSQIYCWAYLLNVSFWSLLISTLFFYVSTPSLNFVFYILEDAMWSESGRLTARWMSELMISDIHSCVQSTWEQLVRSSKSGLTDSFSNE